MAVTIRLYQMTSEKNALTKTMTQKVNSTSAILNDPTSVTDPVILVDGTLTTIFSCNYAYISAFNRYYFITKMVAINTNLVEVSCHVDVLYSFAAAIRNNTALIKRQQDEWNLYLPDNSMATFNSPSTYTKPFSSGFNGFSYVLSAMGAPAGGGSGSREFIFHISAMESSTAPRATNDAYMAMSLIEQPTPYAWAFATMYAPGTSALNAVYQNDNYQATSTQTQTMSGHPSPYTVSKTVNLDEHGDAYIYVYQTNSGTNVSGQGLQLRINNDPTDPNVMVQYNMLSYYNYTQPFVVKLEHTDTYIELEYKPHS